MHHFIISDKLAYGFGLTYGSKMASTEMTYLLGAKTKPFVGPFCLSFLPDFIYTLLLSMSCSTSNMGFVQCINTKMAANMVDL